MSRRTLGRLNQALDLARYSIRGCFKIISPILENGRLAFDESEQSLTDETEAILDCRSPPSHNQLMISENTQVSGGSVKTNTSLFRIIAGASAILCLVGTGPAFGQTEAGFGAQLLDPGGQPVPQARITYTRVPRVEQTAPGKFRPAPGEAQVSASASPQSDGSVNVAALPSGRYLICADAPGYLGTCEWSGSFAIVISRGASLNAGEIRLTKGALVQVIVNDPQHLLPPDNPMTNPLVVGVLDDFDAFHGARQVSAAGTSRTLQVLAPFGREMRLWLHSWKVLVADASGQALDNRGPNGSFVVPAGQPGPTFVVNVTGLAEPE